MKNQNIMTTTFLSLAVALLAQCGNPSANNIKPHAQNNASNQQNSLQLKSKPAHEDWWSYGKSSGSIT